MDQRLQLIGEKWTPLIGQEFLAAKATLILNAAERFRCEGRVIFWSFRDHEINAEDFT